MRPANSPDLNPIKNLWSIMKDEVEKMDPTKVDDLITAINNVWNGITQEVRESLIGSMKDRIDQCITQRGNKTDY